MLKILANENVETEEDRTAYQIDTVLAVKRYLEVCPTDGHTSKYKPKTGPTSGIGARQISDWLGKENCDFRCSH